ncbi:undecaprenyl-phosphate glucose phosphotransferase [Paraburkholderia phenoliruptrix]|uniref:undecaprenyl-phosphate glucose phosphotransferase n=1 Tax=Paraburkholderia phenoliruptrix TaxID=252970 RepID=UPI001C6E8AAA|nr:undecaprenyl-phosphate glucose phosphotransferase [Paraburkholderia phenoliruptrix]MBW9106775.1 undecaprenyl-phosphate glucose phosphotransferase [Paraburkholderia phenoliruptrix]MBW9131836.1 undecaprenyl-phosphate glucose phosphotransferase [Paraburkholderia ginsengiterrae]
MKIVLARLCDIAMTLLGAAIAARLCFGEAVPHPLLHCFSAVMVVALVAMAFPGYSIYLSWRGRPLRPLFLRVLAAWFSVQALACALVFLLGGIHTLSGRWLLVWTLLTAVLLVATRMAVYSMLRRYRHAGHDLRHVSVIGHGRYFDRVSRDTDGNAAAGFKVVDVVKLAAVSADADQSAVDHDIDALRRVHDSIEANAIREVWLALPMTAEASLQRCVDALRGTLIDLRLLPDVDALGVQEHGGALAFIGRPAISLSPVALPREAITGKEVFDRVFAALALLALSPLMLGIALCVKCSSPGPVFFRQRRKGLNGQTFSIYKFRSMRLHAPEHGVVKQATRDDPRITRVGRFLRRTSLDELPQFINVLRGEMSVVGPRPHAIEHDELYRTLISGYMDRYRIKPGITGWAQVNGHRGETERVEKMAARVEHDLYYLRHWSFALDLRIVVATILRGFVGHQAY